MGGLIERKANDALASSRAGQGMAGHGRAGHGLCTGHVGMLELKFRRNG